MSKLKSLRPIHYLITSLIIVLLINFILAFRPPTSLSLLKSQYFSLSPGDRYQAHLTLWRYFLLHSQWSEAQYQESFLDPADVASLKSENYPPAIANRIDQIQGKTTKTVEDWLELAKLQNNLGQKSAAYNAITQAKRLDPIRDDIDQFYRQLSP